MTDLKTHHATKASSSLAEERTRLAIHRTLLASDRTMLAWVRTALSLMTFGFTIYKFFQYLQESGAADSGWTPSGPKHFGLVLIAIATVLLASQTWRGYATLQRARREFLVETKLTPALAAGALVSVLGVLAFINVMWGVPVL